MSVGNTTELILALITGMSVGIACWAMGSLWLESRQVSRDTESMADPPPPLIRLLRPLGRPVSKAFQDMVDKAEKSPNPSHSTLIRFSSTMFSKITAGGLEGSMTPADMIGSSFAAGVIAGALGWYSALIQDYSPPPLIFVGVITGVCLPFIWLTDRVKRRQLEIRKSLPYFLDLLTLCVEAGLDFSTGLVRILPKLGQSPLRFEMERAANEITMGKSRSEALRDLGVRVGLVELSTVVGSIVQSDELGSSLGPVLRLQAGEARRRRLTRAEELALKAPVKIIFPLVAFIFPTTLIIVFGPIALRYLRPLL